MFHRLQCSFCVLEPASQRFEQGRDFVEEAKIIAVHDGKLFGNTRGERGVIQIFSLQSPDMIVDDMLHDG